jgi:hypothetical protein
MQPSRPVYSVARRVDRPLFASFCLSVAVHSLFLLTPSGIRNIPDRAAQPIPVTTYLDIKLTLAPRPALPARPKSAQTFAARPPLSPTVVPRHPDENADHRRTRDSIPSDRNPANTSNRSQSQDSSVSSPSIDYAAAHEIARDTARSTLGPTKKTELDTMLLAEPETVLGRRIKQAAHPDCRTRYASAGLLAIPLLLNDAVRDGGCTW